MRARRIWTVLCFSLIVCLFCLTPAAASAEVYQISKKLREDMPIFRFELAYDQAQYSAEQSEQRAYYDEGAFYYVHSITVISEDTGYIVQQIDLNPAAEVCDDDQDKDKTLGFVLEDMNFDGFLDMRVMQFISAGINIPYYCWLWDPGSQSFAYSEALSAISSPIFDPVRGQVHGFTTDGTADINTIYEYRGYELVLVGRVTTGYDYQAGTMIVTTEELVEGQMLVTDVTKESLFQSEDGQFDW